MEQKTTKYWINSEPETYQKEKTSSKEFDTEDVKIYSLSIPTPMFDELKYEIGQETKLSMRDMILKAVPEHYGISWWFHLPVSEEKQCNAHDVNLVVTHFCQ
ncbi:hypothetical protein FHS59_004698 [Algoriphagus iocasae]|uniref:Uncharacterized protein n=1 Tax=Algoriphagus iocasae TaxID=1836499 RepID=A0A841MWV0_9BACT|nr:hypothetical protein [Algoriphagus iocasae]MBB6329034.1 hypothetical protein [Algoriphagus iocasae]